MMDCREVQDLLPLYEDGDLMPVMQAGIESHLRHCYHCSEYLKEHDALMERVAGVLRHPAPGNDFGQLHERIQRESIILRQSRRFSRRFRYISAGMAAAVTMLVFTIAVPFMPGGDSAHDAGGPVQALEHETIVVDETLRSSAILKYKHSVDDLLQSPPEQEQPLQAGIHPEPVSGVEP